MSFRGRHVTISVSERKLYCKGLCIFASPLQKQTNFVPAAESK